MKRLCSLFFLFSISSLFLFPLLSLSLLSHPLAIVEGVDLSKVGYDLGPVLDGDFLPKSIDELRAEAPRKTALVGTCEYEALIFS